MTGPAWIFLAAAALGWTLLIVTLLGAASKQADMDKAYLRLAARLLRAEAELDRLRGLTRLRAVDEPADQVAARVIDRHATRARFDSIVRDFDGDGA